MYQTTKIFIHVYENTSVDSHLFVISLTDSQSDDKKYLKKLTDSLTSKGYSLEVNFYTSKQTSKSKQYNF